MTSQKQIEANRRNALKSTGPRSQRGREAVRLNSVTHGLTAKSIITHGEEAEIEKLQPIPDSLESEWQPQTITETLLPAYPSASCCHLPPARAATPHSFP